MSIQPKGSVVLTYEQALATMVEAGKMACFTTTRGQGVMRLHVSLRAAVWLLQSLEGKLNSYSEEAVAEGMALKVEYQYGAHSVVLGIYLLCDIEEFGRGKSAYIQRKYKDAMRAMRRAKRARLATEKGGAAL